MSFVVQKASQYLGTDLDGEIRFGSISQGLKPLVFNESVDAWDSLKFAFPDMDIKIDPNTDRAYEIDKDTVRFLAGLKIIKDLVYTAPVESRTKDSDLFEIWKIMGDEVLLKVMREHDSNRGNRETI
jgi:hypothetical protein